MMVQNPDGAATVPATPIQEAVWWAHQRAKDKSLYNLTWRLAGDRPIDVTALQVAWQAVVDRHEVLRTSIVRSGAVVSLNVCPQVAAEVSSIEVDAPGLGDADTILRLLAEEGQARVFELDQPPLARLTLVEVGQRRELVLTVHHIVFDGWALQLLLADLSAAYSAASCGRAPRFAADCVPFHIYAAEQDAARSSGRWQPTIDYWCSKLDGAHASTLIADRPTDPVVGAPGVIARYTFSPEGSAGIRALSTAAFASPFAAVLAALDIVLTQGGAGPDVTVGVVAANRATVRDQGLVGYLANLCISRLSVEPGDTIGEVVARSRDDIWAMLAHQAVPYPAVFGALPAATQTTLGDAAPVLLSYLGQIGSELNLGDTTLTLLPTPNRAARADIAMSIADVAGGHRAEIEYNTARFDESTIIGLLHDMDRVLATGGTDPARHCGSLPIRSRSTVRQASTPEAGPRIEAGCREDSPAWSHVYAAWTELLGGPPAGPDADFFAAGGHSLSVMRLAAALEDRTGVDVDIVDWLAEPSPRLLVAQLTAAPSATGESTDSTLVEVRSGPGPHLHLVPGAGGTMRDYRALIAALPGHWRITGSREREPLSSVVAMAERYRADLDRAGLVPDLLGGWSMGGQIAVEMAAGYRSPSPALVVLDATPPNSSTSEGLPGDGQLPAFFEAVCRTLGLPAGSARPRVSGDVGVHLGALAAHLGAAGQDVSATDLAERWRGFARHVQAAAAHVRQDRVYAVGLIVAADLIDEQLTQWEQLLAGPARRRRIDTDHHGLLLGPAALEVAAEIESFERDLVRPGIRVR